MSDRQPRGINPDDFIGKVFIGDKFDSISSLNFTQGYRALGVHGRERYETPDDDPALKLSESERQKRMILLTQDPIYKDRTRPLIEAEKSGLLLPEDKIKEIWVGVWDRMHDYMAAKNPYSLLAQAKRQARNKRGPNIP